jgi:hypothetical protein
VEQLADQGVARPEDASIALAQRESPFEWPRDADERLQYAGYAGSGNRGGRPADYGADGGPPSLRASMAFTVSLNAFSNLPLPTVPTTKPPRPKRGKQLLRKPPAHEVLE